MATPKVTVGSVMHPIGPLNPKVYWIRRVIVIGIAVALLIGVAWFVVGTGAE